MPQLKVIFHGLCALVPRLPQNGTKFSAITALLPNVPNDELVNKDSIEFSPGQSVDPAKNNHKTFAHKASLRINMGATTTRYLLEGEEVKILVNDQPLAGDIDMLQNDATASELSVNRLANLHEIFKDKGGMSVNPSFLNQNRTPGSLGLAARLTVKGGRFVAHSGTIDGASTLATIPYIFNPGPNQISFDPARNPMAGSAAFITDIVVPAGQKTIVSVVCGTKAFEFSVRASDVEIIIENMPPNPKAIPTPPPSTVPGDHTDTDFLLLYKVANPGKFRLPSTTIPPGGPGIPPIMCGVGMFSPA